MIKTKIQIFQWGGASPYLTQLATRDPKQVQKEAETALRFAPVTGTYYDIKDAVQNPSLRNIGFAAASLGGDILSLFGIGLGVKPWIQGMKAADKVNDAMKTYNRAYDAASAAHGTMVNAERTAKKADDVLKATSLTATNNSQVMKAQRNANAAQEQLKKAQDAYSSAQTALDGKHLTTTTVDKVLPDGSVLKNQKVQKLTGGPDYSVPIDQATDATSQLDHAYYLLNKAQKNKYTPTEWALTLGLNPVKSVAIEAMQGTSSKRQGGIINKGKFAKVRDYVDYKNNK